MNDPLRALVIDDEAQVSAFIAQVLEAEGWFVSQANSAEQAFENLAKGEWALVFCDVVLGGVDGYAVLRRFSQQQPSARFILMTGHSSAAGALDATSIGAYDYLAKPFSVAEILQISKNVLEHHQLSQSEKKNPAKRRKTKVYESELQLIGGSPKFTECLKLVGRVSSTNLPVLITGESGTGKEVVARAIHKRSSRSDGSFVTINCGAIPAELIESELFGHARGSFTGADRERVGLWEEASGGTLLLDEITETSPLFQVKLLRALQEGEIRRVGSNRTIKVDVRIIAATNRDVEEEVSLGRFRRDLMYRLNAVTIHLPALRERLEDIGLLAEHFAKTAGRELAREATFSESAYTLMENYDWPGNIRELENAVLHAVTLCDNVVYPEHLPSAVRNYRSSASAIDDLVLNAVGDEYTQGATNEWRKLADVEQNYVRRVLEHANGNKRTASRILNIDPKTLSRIIARSS